MVKNRLTYDEGIALKNPHFAEEIKRYIRDLKRLSKLEILDEYGSSRGRGGTTAETIGFRSLQRKCVEQEILRRMKKKRIKK